MKKLLFIALFIVILGAAHVSFAQELESNCVVSATVTDNDPNGLNVRSKPNVNGKIVTVLKRDAGETLKVYVVGYANGWVKIGGAYKTDGKGTIFQDSGWVSAKLLAVVAGENAELYQQSSGKNALGTKVPAGTLLPIVGFDCLIIKVAYKGKTGWLKSMSE